jgi:hydrogenase assembly chaperone HypC/HupF
MCIAAPGQITKIEGHRVTVKHPGGVRFALLGDEKVKKGNYVMVQMGIVVKVLTPTEAKKSLKAWRPD